MSGFQHGIVVEVEQYVHHAPAIPIVSHSSSVVDVSRRVDQALKCCQVVLTKQRHVKTPCRVFIISLVIDSGYEFKLY